MKKIIAAALCAILLFTVTSGCSVVRKYHTDFYIDASNEGKEIKNLVSVINQFVLWDDYSADYDKTYFKDRYPFCDYVQFMTATGGSASKDLFADPYNREVTDDYDFTKLLSALHNALNVGAVPWIKTGMIPLKLSTEPALGMFGVNLREPYDYDLYYNYIYAMALAVKEEFGEEEVAKWRWGVFTEFNNADWFIPSEDKNIIEEFCKVYDYSVKALEDALGNDVFVGAHGLFSIDDFIIHCGTGTNYATGQTGSHIDYIADSYYAQTPTIGAGYMPSKKIAHMRDVAESVGLTDIIYGIDEGRILDGSDSKPLTDRKVGYSVQGANDAFFYKDFLDNDLDFFSSWSYSSTGLFGGIDTVSLHVANCFSKMVGSKRVAVEAINNIANKRDEHTDAFAGYNESTKTLSVMSYNYYEGMYTTRYKAEKTSRYTINAPQLEGKVKVTKYVINDSCNFFDDWVAMWPELGIIIIGPGADVFDWSRDSAQCQTRQCIKDENIYNAFIDRLPQLTEAAKLVPEVSYAEVKNGSLTLSHKLVGQEVAFFTVESAE